ncbi:MAG TPA: hypothetical protein VGM84_21695 [Steroidobacteraceae bacterium]
MKLSRSIIAGILVILCLTGCNGERVSFATTRFDPNDVNNMTVAVLPVVKSTRVADLKLPEDKILETVVKESRFVGIKAKKVGYITAEMLRQADLTLDFPLTPERLAFAARKLKFGAALGVSVATAVESKPQLKQKAEVELFISFADARESSDTRPPARWTLSGSWYGRDLAGIAESFQGLGFHLIDLEFWAKDAFKTVMSAGAQIYATDQPLLTIANPTVALGSKTPPRIADKSIALTLTAVYDSGIESVTVANEAAGFSRTLYSRTNDSAAGKAIYVTVPIIVPLVHGQNDIKMTAAPTAGLGSPSSRTESLISTTPPVTRALLVGVSSYEELGDVEGTQGAAAAFANVLSSKSHPGGSRQVQAPQASDLEFRNQLSGWVNASAVDDTLILYLSGRVGGGLDAKDVAPYLALKSAPRQAPQVASLPLSTLRYLMAPRPTAILFLDLCSDSGSLDPMRASISRVLPNYAVFSLTHCSEQNGVLGKAAAAWWLKNPSAPEPRLSDWLAETASAEGQQFTRGTAAADPET